MVFWLESAIRFPVMASAIAGGGIESKRLI
jgi:hypothetical protein